MTDAKLISELITKCEPGKAVYFTVKNKTTDGYKTFRVKKQSLDAAFRPGEYILGHLTGCDNQSSYTGFAFLNGTVKTWSKYQNTPLDKCAKIVQELILDQKEHESLEVIPAGRCYRCGRPLTVPSSVSRGLGPDCASKL